MANQQPKPNDESLGKVKALSMVTAIIAIIFAILSGVIPLRTTPSDPLEND